MCPPTWGGGVLPEKNVESNALWWPYDVKLMRYKSAQMEFQAFPGDYHGRAFQGLESRFMKLQFIPGFPGCRQTPPLQQCWEGVTGLSPMEGGTFRRGVPFPL